MTDSIPSSGSTTDRITLITGASRGIGRALSEHIAGPGHTLVLIATPKSQGALEELDDVITAKGGHAVLVPMDLTQADGIDHLGAVLYERFGKLDALAGCAAHLGPISPIHHIDPKTMDRTFAVNTMANWRLIRSMMPLMLLSDSPRAVFLTDSQADTNQPFWAHYSASKAALNGIVKTWAEEVKKTPIRANLFDPGRVATRLRRTAMPGEDQSSFHEPESIAPSLAKLISVDETRHGELIRFTH